MGVTCTSDSKASDCDYETSSYGWINVRSTHAEFNQAVLNNVGLINVSDTIVCGSRTYNYEYK